MARSKRWRDRQHSLDHAACRGAARRVAEERTIAAKRTLRVAALLRGRFELVKEMPIVEASRSAMLRRVAVGLCAARRSRAGAEGVPVAAMVCWLAWS